jgi:hypothetical protein
MASRPTKSRAKSSSKANDKAVSKKPKLVRDSFSIPKNEFTAIDALKVRAIALGTSVKKSELLRAGLMALQAMSDAGFKAAVAAVPTLKTGRPAAELPAAAKPVVKAAVKAVVKAPAKAAVKAPAKPVQPTRSRSAAKPAAKAAAKPAARPAAKAPAKSARQPAAKQAVAAPRKSVAQRAA